MTDEELATLQWAHTRLRDKYHTSLLNTQQIAREHRKEMNNLARLAQLAPLWVVIRPYADRWGIHYMEAQS